jgi:hypothetical protein
LDRDAEIEPKREDRLNFPRAHSNFDTGDGIGRRATNARMTEQSAATEVSRGQPQASKTRSRALGAAVIAVAGGVLTAGALYLVSNNASTGDSSNLSILPAPEIASATPTIDPAASSQLTAAARNCTAPLAYVSIAGKPGGAGGAIRIRSGSYLSPAFEVADVPQRVAIPFPAPYPLGHGTISVEGSAADVMIALFPTWRIEALGGAATRNVFWKPGNPCQ